MTDKDKAKKVTAPAVKNTVAVKSTLTANFDHVVTAKVGRLELKLNHAVTSLTASITSLRNEIATEEKAIAAWAKKTFVKPALLSSIPPELNLNLTFGPVSVQLTDEPTAHWSLLVKSAYEGRQQHALANYEQPIPAEQTVKYFELKNKLSTAETDLFAVRRELTQLDSKTRILRGAAAEAQLRDQGLEHLLTDMNDTEILAVPANVAALIGQEKVIEHNA